MGSVVVLDENARHSAPVQPLVWAHPKTVDAYIDRLEKGATYILCCSHDRVTPSVTEIMDRKPVRCMAQQDLNGYVDFVKGGPPSPLDLSDISPTTFARFSAVWHDIWLGNRRPLSAAERIVAAFAQNGDTPIQILYEDRVLFNDMFPLFGAPPPVVTLLNICIRALGCRIDHIHSFGKWVDADHIHQFIQHCAELRENGISLWKDKQVIGYDRLGRWLMEHSENDYAKLRPVLKGIVEAKTGDELMSKIKLPHIAGYRSHLFYTLLCATNISPIANRRMPQPDACVIGPGAARGLALLNASLETLHAHYNPLRLCYDDIEHNLCFFNKLYKTKNAKQACPRAVPKKRVRVTVDSDED